VTTSKFEPIDWIDDWIELCAPWPTEIMAMTEPMPITMPRTVNPDRILFAVTAE
jgi:hypothetical protein